MRTRRRTVGSPGAGSSRWRCRWAPARRHEARSGSPRGPVPGGRLQVVGQPVHCVVGERALAPGHAIGQSLVVRRREDLDGQEGRMVDGRPPRGPRHHHEIGLRGRDHGPPCVEPPLDSRDRFVVGDHDRLQDGRFETGAVRSFTSAARRSPTGTFSRPWKYMARAMRRPRHCRVGWNAKGGASTPTSPTPTPSGRPRSRGAARRRRAGTGAASQSPGAGTPGPQRGRGG